MKQRGARSSKVHCPYAPFGMPLVEVLDDVRKEKRASWRTPLGKEDTSWTTRGGKIEEKGSGRHKSKDHEHIGGLAIVEQIEDLSVWLLCDAEGV